MVGYLCQTVLGAVLNSLGLLAYQKGDIKTAQVFYNRRLALAEALRNPEGKAVAFYNLARHCHPENKSKAIELYEKAIETAKLASRLDIIAASQRRLASIYKEMRDDLKAKKYIQDSYTNYDLLGNIPDEVKYLSDEIMSSERYFNKLWQKILTLKNFRSKQSK